MNKLSLKFALCFPKENEITFIEYPGTHVVCGGTIPDSGSTCRLTVWAVAWTDDSSKLKEKGIFSRFVR